MFGARTTYQKRAEETNGGSRGELLPLRMGARSEKAEARELKVRLRSFSKFAVCQDHDVADLTVCIVGWEKKRLKLQEYLPR